MINRYKFHWKLVFPFITACIYAFITLISILFSGGYFQPLLLYSRSATAMFFFDIVTDVPYLIVSAAILSLVSGLLLLNYKSEFSSTDKGLSKIGALLITLSFLIMFLVDISLAIFPRVNTGVSQFGVAALEAFVSYDKYLSNAFLIFFSLTFLMGSFLFSLKHLSYLRRILSGLSFAFFLVMMPGYLSLQRPGIALSPILRPSLFQSIQGNYSSFLSQIGLPQLYQAFIALVFVAAAFIPFSYIK